MTGALEPATSLEPHLALILKVSYLTVCLLGLGINLLLLTIIVGRSRFQGRPLPPPLDNDVYTLP